QPGLGQHCWDLGTTLVSIRQTFSGISEWPVATDGKRPTSNRGQVASTTLQGDPRYREVRGSWAGARLFDCRSSCRPAGLAHKRTGREGAICPDRFLAQADRPYDFNGMIDEGMV